jgi:hypothetical protein
MKTEDFKKLIRGIIQEELKKELPVLIPKILAEISARKATTPRIVETKRPVAPVQPKAPIRYSSNPMINEVLNQTKLKSTGDSYVGLDLEHDMIMPQAPIYAMALNDDQPVLNESIEHSVEESYESPVPPVSTQAPIMKSIVKDYRSLLKAVDEKKRGGAFNSGMVGMM